MNIVSPSDTMIPFKDLKDARLALPGEVCRIASSVSREAIRRMNPAILFHTLATSHDTLLPKLPKLPKMLSGDISTAHLNSKSL